MEPHALILPHGGELVERIKTDSEFNDADYEQRIEISARTFADLECIATGIYSPLTGFMQQADYDSCSAKMRLANGLPWSIPVTLAIESKLASSIALDSRILLTWQQKPIANMVVKDKYQPDKKQEAIQVYGTDDVAHPGVQALLSTGDIYLGGPIELLSPITHSNFQQYRLTPKQTRAYFKQKGWQTIVAFQTRNPIHRAHEYLQKTALEMVDGLFVNPLVGTTKNDDVPADVRMHTYEVILEKYYPQDRVLLGVFPAAMRYAGPREAIMHAIARKNYGCSHFIVGRDHAGVGDYYGTYDAQEIFDQFTVEEIGITPLKFEHAFNCRACGQMASSKTCPHDQSQHMHLSGTKVRAMLNAGEMPPAEFTRPEVAKILITAYQEVYHAA